jgi:DNA ligase-1
MVDAVAKAAALPSADLRRAHMLAGDLAVVARAALMDGAEGLARFRLEVLRPIGPMLAQSAGDVAEALTRTGPAGIEWKLDGARLQVHRSGHVVRAFTRSLADVTDRVPEVVAATMLLPLDAAVLDSEVIALTAEARPLSFQETMSRFGSSSAQSVRDGVPLTPFFFDCLHLDGEDLLERPYSERAALLATRVPEDRRIPRIETADPAAGEAFLDAALARGHEGVLVKSLAAPYEAGRRGSGWVKVKRAQTTRPRRARRRVGPRPTPGTPQQPPSRRARPGERRVRHARQDVQGHDGRDARLADREAPRARRGAGGPRRPRPAGARRRDRLRRRAAQLAVSGGLALRFARVKGYRPDKTPAEADTIDAVRASLGGGAHVAAEG